MLKWYKEIFADINRWRQSCVWNN